MLELLHGPDRTANSMELLEQICRNAKSGVSGQILIVPEQYSHETERALCMHGGETISRYAEVLSFTRLATRVFSVYGGVCEEYLDENGRILTLYLAAQQVREQLKFYAAVMTRPDFLKQLGTLMEELLTSCITPDALHAAAARLEGRLAQKITELALLYESYLSVCKTGRGDPVTRQMRLCELLDETEFLDWTRDLSRRLLRFYRLADSDHRSNPCARQKRAYRAAHLRRPAGRLPDRE